MSLTVATLIGAIATGVLAIGALITAGYAKKAFDKQSEQLNDQKAANQKLTEAAGLQVTELRNSIDQRELERQQSRRAQASRVFMWLDPPGTNPSRAGRRDSPAGYAAIVTPRVDLQVCVAHVKNSSDQPVYSLQYQWQQGPTPYAERDLPTSLRPDAEDSNVLNVPADGDPHDFTATITFRDAAGVPWHLGPNGELTDLSPPPVPARPPPAAD